MTLDQFRSLRPVSQLVWVIAEGTSLAQRWEKQAGVVTLYYLADAYRGFFVEVGLATGQDYFQVLASFTNSAPLADYASQIQLPVL